MKRSSSKAKGRDEFRGDVDWELRPGGMIVQKRNYNVASDHSNSTHMITIKVSHGSYRHDITVNAQSTFGDLKRVLWEETGLEAKDQRILFKGKEKENEEWLHMAGVNDMSKVILMEDPASKERKLKEMKKNRFLATEAVAQIRTEVDKLSQKVLGLERRVNGGGSGGERVEEKEVNVLIELLMVELLKLDAIETDGDAKLQRRTEVVRVQNFVDRLDSIKARSRSINPLKDRTDSVSVTAKWETFNSGFGTLNLNAPTSKPSSTKITHDWELFD